MATTNQNASIWSRISAPSALLIVTALFAGLFIAPTFQSARPRSPEMNFDPARQIGRARGLITLDPLEQAYAEAGSATAGESVPYLDTVEGPFSLKALATELVRDLAPNGSALNEQRRALVLLESVRGGTLSEDHERRLRGRFATAAALVREELFPRDSKRLHLLWFPSAAAEPPRDDSNCPKVLIPYEWFDAARDHAGRYRRAVVCWIDEAAIERAPATFGTEFVERLSAALAQLPGTDWNSRVDVRWVGPTTSGRLSQLLDGLEQLDSAKRASTDLKIVTPYATSPRIAIPAEYSNWESKGVSVRRSVGTDDRLARLLINELLLRVPKLLPMLHPDDTTRSSSSPAWLRALAAPLRVLRFVPKPRPDEIVRVALITEQDSTYGQAWISNMRDARDQLARSAGAGGGHPQLESIEFTVFPVFGWVDGVVRDKELRSAATDFAVDYPAEGHQLDYLQRLRDDLQAEGEFAAVGVFVTEEYDTLMILEAVRPQFPGALFFTTDIDARYLHARHAPFTRNLIVASHFGLQPEDDPDGAPQSGSAGAGTNVRRATPEFRDGYQSSVYRTVRDLVRGATPTSPASAAVYEIGRTQIVRLNASAGDESVSPPVLPDATDPSLPARLARALLDWRPGSEVNAAELPAARPSGAYVVALLSIALFIAAVMVFGVGPRPARALRPSADVRALRGSLAVLAVLLLLVVALGVATLTQSTYPAEPMFAVEGVSAWPTFALRGVMLAVSIYSLLSITSAMKRSHARIAADYELDPAAEPVSASWVVDWLALGGFEPRTADEPRWRRGLRGLATLLGLRPVPDLPQRSLDSAWRFVGVHLERPRYVLLRAFGLSLALYFMLAPFFALAQPGANPVRGEFAYLVDRLSLFASIFAFLMLLMLVMEATFFANRLIGRLVDAEALTLPASCGDGPLERKERLVLARRVANSVERLIWSPMIVLGLMIAARASLFDAWAWPTVLMGVFGLFLLMFLVCIVSMRRVCERAKSHALEELAAARARAGADAAASRALGGLLEDIAGFTGGAFSPLIQHPMIRALMVPLAAFGANFVFERNLIEQVLGAL